MESNDIQRLLNEGIAAVRRGDKASGRDLLLQVVQADDRIEPAWLWLSSAVDDPHDKLVALENALTLNPGNDHAQKEADRLRQALGIAVPDTPPAPQPAAPAPAPLTVPVTPPDSDEDPLQCPFCGKLTSDIEDHCPHCQRSLLVPGTWRGGWYDYILLMVLALATQMALLQMLGPVVGVGLHQGIEPDTLVTVSRLPGVTLFFGDFLNWSAAVALGLAIGGVARFLLVGGTLVLFLDKSRHAYRAGAIVPLVDLLLNGAGFVFGYGGLLALGLNAALDLMVVLPASAALLGQRQARVRQRVLLDTDAHGAVEFNRRGLRYAQEGRWAMAALHQQRAMVLDPHVPEYFKDLARAQAQLGRWAKALATLKEGARRSPNDAQFTAAMAEVEKKGR